MIDGAVRRAEGYEKYRPRVVRAIYRKADDMLVLVLATGVEVGIPRRLLQGLEQAKSAEVAAVEVEDFGSSLHWDSLDVDHYVPELLGGLFGTRRWMSEIGKAGGSARSVVKAKAVRENGRKGGRPKKRAATKGTPR